MQTSEFLRIRLHPTCARAEHSRAAQETDHSQPRMSRAASIPGIDRWLDSQCYIGVRHSHQWCRGKTIRPRMRESTASTGLSDDELNSGQKGLLEDLLQWECSTKRMRQIRFPTALARTMAPSKAELRSARDSIRPGRSHSRCSRCDGRVALRANRDRALESRDRLHAGHCPGVQSRDCAYESEGMSVSIVSIHTHTRHVPGDATIGQGMTSSEVSHRRQFWQSSPILIAEITLYGFR